jgi:hypothetical protein
MLTDRRQAARHAVNRIGRIQCGTGTLPRDCLITDVSDGGVRLHVEGMEVPDQFTLHFSGSRPQRRECSVVWRLGCELGAQFIDSAPTGFARGMALSYATLSKGLER